LKIFRIEAMHPEARPEPWLRSKNHGGRQLAFRF